MHSLLNNSLMPKKLNKSDEHRKAIQWWLPLLVGLLATLPFWDGIGNDFVWDDQMNIVENSNIHELDRQSIEWMSSETYGGHYHPLTWLTLAINYHFSEDNPAPYIATNIVMHGIASGLLFLLICQLLTPLVNDISRARQLFIFAVAALFWALHPLRVESVIWITERRDVLSGIFVIAALLAYVKYAQPTPRQWAWYGVCLIAACLSLLSKAWAITLPLIMLALDLYPLKRKLQPSLFLEKIPFFILSLAFGLRALDAQATEALASLSSHGIAARIAQIFYNLGFLPAKTLLPTDLSPLYLLRPEFSLSSTWVILSIIAVTLITSICLKLAFKKEKPAPLIAWASAIIIMLPVAGIAQSGSQITADRYTYLAAIPFSLLLAGGMHYLVKRFGIRHVATSAALILLALSAATSRQSLVWKNADTLWTHAIQQDPTNYVAYYNRATVGRDPSDLQGQYDDLTEAIKLNPDYAGAYNNRGRILLSANKPENALEDFRNAVRSNPTLPEAYVNIGATYLQHFNSTEKAHAAYTKALELETDNYAALTNLGLIYQRQGDLDTAITYHKKALKAHSTNGIVWLNLGLCYLDQNNLEQAQNALKKASTHASSEPECWYALAQLHLKLNQPKDAAKALKQALKVAPKTWQRADSTKQLLKNTESQIQQH